jgi:hypothetical protein
MVCCHVRGFDVEFGFAFLYVLHDWIGLPKLVRILNCSHKNLTQRNMSEEPSKVEIPKEMEHHKSLNWLHADISLRPEGDHFEADLQRMLKEERELHQKQTQMQKQK